uniref:VWFA domain-containing protein n=1 Tax=Biomphalaria glabrata TaxID=6526 RepID=A0A2C9M569_BIOGL
MKLIHLIIFASVFLSGHSQSTSCDGKADILLIVDASGSIGLDDFGKMKQFLANFVVQFSIGKDFIQFSQIVFSSDSNISFGFNKYLTGSSLKNALLNSTYIGGGTETGKALNQARTLGFTSANGARADVPKLALVFTDGQSNDGNLTSIEAHLLKDSGVVVLAIGIGVGINYKELQDMATRASYVFNVSSYQELYSSIDRFSNIICKAQIDASNTNSSLVCLGQTDGVYAASLTECVDGYYYKCVNQTAMQRRCNTSSLYLDDNNQSYTAVMVFDQASQTCQLTSNSCPRGHPTQLTVTDICDECQYNGGFGYDSDPDYCDTFYQCMPDLKPIKKLCPAGTFWDGDRCNFIDAVKCTKAVCTSATQGVTYPSGRCCNKYYECYNSKLYERLCPTDQFYDSVTRRCGPTANKNATCESLGRFECDVNRYLGLPSCNGYAPDPFGNPCKYQFNGYSFQVAAGTVWSQKVCSLVPDYMRACVVMSNERAFEPTNGTCNVNFLASYNSGSKAIFSERAGTNIDIATTQQEVLLTNNALTFTAAMVSPYFYYYFFNNKDMGIDTAFRVRFSLQGGQDGKTYDILSNSYCSLCPDTIKFTVYQSSVNSYVVTATFLTTERATVETSATISNVNPSNLLELTVVYSDTSVYGKLYEVNTANTVVRTVDFGRVGKTGGVHIATNKCGIQLGRGANNHFVGIIDEFAIYEKCLTINQVFRP